MDNKTVTMLKNKFLFFFLITMLASCTSKNVNYFLFKKNDLIKSKTSINIPQKIILDTFENYYSTVRKDGRYLIYVSNKTGNLDLWLYDFLTKNNYRITYHSSDDFMPAFSSDGEKVVFISYRSDSRGDIWSIDFNDILERAEEGLDEDYVKELLKDDGAEQITENHIPESEPVFMPDSKYILFVRDEKRRNIFLKKLKLSSTSELIIKNGISPASSPDGKYIAFVNVSSNSNLKNHLCLYNLKDKSIKQLIFGNSIEASPVFINSYTLLYSSIKFDSNKNQIIDFNDNSSIFLFNLRNLKEYQITTFQNMDIYPSYTKLYGGSIIYTSTHKNDLNLWMLPVDGIIPFVNNKALQLKIADNIGNPYNKLLGYKKIIEYYSLTKNDKNKIIIREGKIWQQLGYRTEAQKVFSSIISTNSNLTASDVYAEKELILLNRNNKIKKLKNLLIKYKYIKYTSKSDLKEAYYSIFYSLSLIYEESNDFRETIIALKKIISGLNKNFTLYKKALKKIIFLYMDMNRFGTAEKYFIKFLNAGNINNIKVQDEFLEKYLKLKINDYNRLLNKFRGYKFFSFNIRFHFGKYFKNRRILKYIVNHDFTENKIFKIRAMSILADIEKNKIKKLKFLHNILKFSNIADSVLKYTKNRLTDIYLKNAEHLFNMRDYLGAKSEYKKILKYDAANIDALTGILRCDFKLTKPDEKKYKLLLEPYKKVVNSNPYAYKYHYLLGYGYSLIYSHYYNLYLLASIKGEPSIFTKFINIFKSKKNLMYPSYYKKMLEKYFALGKHELQISYRIETDWVISYLTLGYLYQLQDEIEPEKNYIRYAIPIYNSALFYNDEKKYPYRESMVYLNLANINFRMKNYSIADKYYRKKLEYSDKFQNLEQEAFFYYHLGYSQWQIGNDDSSGKNFSKAFGLFVKTKNKMYAFRSLVFEAMILRFNKNYDASIAAYNRAINFIKSNNLKINFERLIREIGICYFKKHNNKKALNYFQMADKIIPKDKYLHWWQKPCFRIGVLDYTIPVWPADITLGQSFAFLGFKNRDEQKLLYTLMGDTYLHSFDFTKAIEYYLLKKKLMEEDNNKDALPYIYNQLALIYFKLNDFNTSRKYFFLSNKYINKLKVKDYNGIVKNNLNIINTYFKTDKNVNEYFSDVIDILEDTYNMIKDKKNNEKDLILIYEKYGLLYFKKAILKKYNSSLKLESLDRLTDKLKKIYKEYLLSLKYYLNAYILASKIHNYIFAAEIKYNIGKIYYMTGDVVTAVKYFNEVYDLAYKYSIDDLKWKAGFIIDKINNEINYEKYISYIENVPRGYNYTVLSDFNIQWLYSAYLKKLYADKKYYKFIETSERKRNFIIKNIFLSYPIELNFKDAGYMKNIRNIEYKLIEEKKKLSQLLISRKRDTGRIEKVKSIISSIKSNRNKLLEDLKNKRPYLSYLVDKNIISMENIQNSINTNTLFLGFDVTGDGFYSYIITRTNKKIFEFNITNLNITKQITDNYYNYGKIKDVKPNWINTIYSNVKNYENIIIIPDEYFYTFPFSEFFTNKKISYDISLSQYYFNLNCQPVVFDRPVSLNYDFNSADIKGISLKDSVSEDLFKKYFSRSSAVHIIDGIKRDKFNPLNFSIIYNEDYYYKISKLTEVLFKGEYISIENSDAYYQDRYTFLSTLIPFYYMNAPTIMLPLMKIKEKYLIKFWNDFYKNKSVDIISRLGNFGRRIKAVYGNRGVNIDTKIFIQRQKIDSIKNKISRFKSINNFTNAIEEYKILLNEVKIFNNMSTNNRINVFPIYTNMVELYVDMTNYKGALNTINMLSNFGSSNSYIIKMVSNIEKMLYEKENIPDVSCISNSVKSNISNLSAIMSVKTNFTNKLKMLDGFLSEIKSSKDKYIKKIINRFLDENYIDAAYKYIRLLKAGTANMQDIAENTLFIDLYASDKNLYMFILNNTNLNYLKKDIEKINKYIENFYTGVEVKNNEDVIDSLDDISEYLLGSIEVSKYSNIIFYPCEDYYNIPYYALRYNNSYIISNKNIIVCNDYKDVFSKSDIKHFRLLEAGYKLNSDGKVIKDFSYKEVRAIKNIFKRSYFVINSSLNDVKGKYNIVHIAMSITTNFYIENKYNAEQYKLSRIINKFQPEFLFLSKYSRYKKLIVDKNKIIFNLWRYNDAISAIWVKYFYKNLYKYRNFESAYIETVRYMLNKYVRPIDVFNFYFIK